MTYSVSETAKMFDINASTLRYYDKEGLLPFVERSEGGVRVFKDADLSLLRIIDCLKRTGMPIKEIKRFVDYCVQGDTSIDQRLEVLSAQRADVIQQMKALQDNLDMIEYKCWYYETASKVGSCSIHDSLPIEKVPARFHRFLHL
jgi:DNA-binding transcriptional MerR regulator